MSETVFKGPGKNISVSGFASWTNGHNVHSDSSKNFEATTSVPARNTWINCFKSSDIPLSANIEGVEFILTGTTGSNGIGSNSAAGSKDTVTIEIRAYNGSSYSSVIYTDISYGPNDYDNPTIGGSSDLHGITWSTSKQVDFGFSVECVSAGGTATASMFKGCAMKVYYSLGFDKIQRINNRPASEISIMNGVAIENIQVFNGKK